MPKSMASLDNGFVVNVEWHSSDALETAELKNIGDYPVDIGDVYENGSYYRDGIKLLTPLEEAQKRLAYVENILEQIQEVYESDENTT